MLYSLTLQIDYKYTYDFIVYQARVGILTPSLEKNYNMCDIQELMIDDGTEEKFKRETCLTFLSCHVTI